MSDSFLVLIPADPGADLPTTASAVRDALADMINAAEARVKDYGKLQFIDCGQNFDQVSCPNCAAKISIERWQVWMDEDWQGEAGFHLHRHDMPCCETLANSQRFNL